MNWWNESLCKMCDAGMCEAVDTYKAEGLSEISACEKAAQDTDGFYTARQIQRRYRYHSGKDKAVTNCETKMSERETAFVLAEDISSGEIPPEAVAPVISAYDRAIKRQYGTDDPMDLLNTLQAISRRLAEGTVDADESMALLEQIKDVSDRADIGLGRWALFGKDQVGLRKVQRIAKELDINWQRVCKCMEMAQQISSES